MTRLQRACLLVAAASLLAMLGLAAVADSHSPQSWTVPPSAVVAITASRAGAQGSLAVGPVDEEGTGPIPDVASIRPQGHTPAGTQTAPSPVPAPSLRLPRWSAGDPGPQPVGTPIPSTSASAPGGSLHSLAELVRVGVASWYDNGSGLYAALPGPWRAGRWVQVCGPARCLRAPIVTSCACGSHVIDLSPQLWEAVSGMNSAERWRYGVTSVSLVIGRAS